jgi:CBS domain-containing protein
MKVQDIMTLPPQTCHLHTDLATASRRMQDAAVGTLVVIDDRGRVKGIVTDRDLALAIGGDRGVERVPVGQVMTRPVRTCKPEDELQDALTQMARHGVHRLPVITGAGDLRGVLSIDDIILWGVTRSGVTRSALTSALRRICASRAGTQELDLPGF